MRLNSTNQTPATQNKSSPEALKFSKAHLSCLILSITLISHRSQSKFLEFVSPGESLLACQRKSEREFVVRASLVGILALLGCNPTQSSELISPLVTTTIFHLKTTNPPTHSAQLITPINHHFSSSNLNYGGINRRNNQR